VREQAARERGTREQAAREPAPREQITRDQFRAALRRSAGAALEQLAQNNSESQSFGDERPWQQRALEPELVPDPPAGVSNLWPMMLRLGAVCTIAATVAAAVVFLFSAKQTMHKIAQANASPPSVADDAAPSAIESSRGVTVETSAGVTTPPPSQIPQPQVAAATPPQLAEGPVAAAPALTAEKPAQPAETAQQLASLPAPNSSAANIKPSPMPAANESTARPVDANPAPPPAPIQTAPIQTAPAQVAPSNVARPGITLDQNEIDTLIRRGKNLLNDGDFAAARLLFERAANAGSAEAALALGSTYDPSVIKQLGAVSVSPDLDRALKWYETAVNRGSADAADRYANLARIR
jgi:hypothetical protein